MLPSTDNLQREYITWQDIDVLIDHLLPQFRGEFDGLLMITRGGMIPGGCLVEALGIEHVLTASVYFDPAIEYKLAWPAFMQFPNDTLLMNRRILIVDNIWANGRKLVVVKSRVVAAGAQAEVAVLHYRPHSNLFPNAGPDYYGAITDRFIVYPWEPPPVIETAPDTRPILPIN